MGRPFSYNDENFTVIGNLLFVHIHYLEQIMPDQPFMEIPPAIYSRMLTYGNMVIESTKNDWGGSYYYLKVIDVNNKHYFSLGTQRDRIDIPRYYFCFYALKDI